MKYVHSLHSAGIAGFIRMNRPFLLHYILFVVSFVFGVLSVVYGFAFGGDNVFPSWWSSMNSSGFLLTFLSFLSVGSIVALSMLACGFFVLGVPLCIGIFCVYGLGTGCLFATVCRAVGWIGVVYNAALFLVPSLVLFAVYAALSAAASSAAAGLVETIVSGRVLSGFRRRITDLIALFGISLLATAAVSALRALLVMLFSDVINI